MKHKGKKEEMEGGMDGSKEGRKGKGVVKNGRTVRAELSRHLQVCWLPLWTWCC